MEKEHTAIVQDSSAKFCTYACLAGQNYICSAYYIQVYNYTRMQNIFHQEGFQVLLKRFWLEFRDTFLRNFSMHLGDFKVSSVKLVHAYRTLWRKKKCQFFVVVVLFFSFLLGQLCSCLKSLCTVFPYWETAQAAVLLLTICWDRSCERSSAYFEKLIVINSFVWFSN